MSLLPDDERTRSARDVTTVIYALYAASFLIGKAESEKSNLSVSGAI